MLNRAQNIAPADPAPSAALAEVQTKRKDYGAAADSYGTALRITKSSGIFGTQSVLYQALAQTQIAARQTDAALATLTRAMGDEPGSAYLWQRLRGEALLASGDNTSAVTAYRAALDAQTDIGTFPQETLATIAAHGLLDRITLTYITDLNEADTGFATSTTAGGGISVSNRNAAKGAIQYFTNTLGNTKEVRGARACAALAAIAQYRNDVPGEITHREALTKMRNRASDWFALAEAYEQRARDTERARAAYATALNMGGLSETQADRARVRVRRMSANKVEKPTP